MMHVVCIREDLLRMNQIIGTATTCTKYSDKSADSGGTWAEVSNYINEFGCLRLGK